MPPPAGSGGYNTGMPNVLAIETSTELASVALLYENRVLSRESSGVQTHSQSVLPMIRQLLDEAGIAMSACDAIAFGAGPGSFTGVRTACGIAQGLGFGANRPLLPVVTLLAMAEACRAQTGSEDVIALLDARMDEIYWAQYRVIDGNWQAVSEPALSAPAAVRLEAPATLCGNGLPLLRAAGLVPGGMAIREGIMPHAVQVAQLGAADLARNLAVDAAHAQPLYVRNKVALTTDERLARSRA